jgi:hypothetical protein
MSLSIPQVPIEILFSGACLAALLIGFSVLTWVVSHWRRASRADTQRLFEQLDLLLGEVRNQAELIQQTVARVDALSERMTQTAQSMPAPAAGVAGVRGYETAIRMARNGSSAQQLMESCGLTRHEAELLIRLHGKSPIANPQPTQARASAQTSPPREVHERPQPRAQDAPVWPMKTATAAGQRTSRLSVVG